ncbi:predicted protein [Plenodomus lingam JN3]|uniref:Predicted protein n=1 Tax=Leptosphaeria maculans (strain JN3 / isolate v23.1.3 / race Av1-4-5-6-7-8) TaxID=985895 RepID=E4ZT82_LEPMJ|nr:predicted protein [Plenodomus lingam JN3]CBX90024.1 predicted protein [Plenodomus lingam JN3]
MPTLLDDIDTHTDPYKQDVPITPGLLSMSRLPLPSPLLTSPSYFHFLQIVARFAGIGFGSSPLSAGDALVDSVLDVSIRSPSIQPVDEDNDTSYLKKPHFRPRPFQMSRQAGPQLPSI